MIHYIQSTSELSKVMMWLEGRRVFAFDTETGPGEAYIEDWERDNKIGLDPYRSQLVTLQIGDADIQFIVDFRSVDVTALKPVLEDPSVLKVGVNLRFDFKMVMHHLGVVPRGAVDCMIIEQIVRNGVFPNRKTDSGSSGLIRKYTSMKSLAARYLNEDIDKDDDLRLTLWKTPVGGFNRRQLLYMANDCVFPMQILALQKPLIKERALERVVNLENRLVSVIADMEYTGLPFDADYWASLLQDTSNEVSKAQRVLDDYFGTKAVSQEDLFGNSSVVRTINYSSSPQLGKALHDRGVDFFYVPESRKYEMTKQNLIRAKLYNIIPAELADAILTFKGASKREDAYGKNFLRAINPVTGRIHPEYTQTELVTGRMSATPGVQTIPSTQVYRSGFRAPPGYKLIVLDASQIEPRLACDLTEDLPGIEVFNKDGDIYKEDGERFFERPIDKSTPEGHKMRQMAKVTWLGLIYGQQKGKFHKYSEVFLKEPLDRSVTDDLFDKFWAIHWRMRKGMEGWTNLVDHDVSTRILVDPFAPTVINKDTAAARLFMRYDRLLQKDKKAAEQKVDFALEHLDYLTFGESALGRKRFFTYDQLGYWTASKNTPIQSTAADIQKATLLAYQELHWKEGFDAHVVLVVHDELVTLVREDQAEELFHLQKRLGEEVGQTFLRHVPMKMEGGYDDVWRKY